MEALFQIVGCVLSSKPAAKRINDFVAHLRRERAVVMDKDAHRAMFVRFSAPDARLVTLACQAVLGEVPSSLRFGFAAGIKEPMLEGRDGLSISNRCIAQAGDLAAGARDGEVLVSAQLAVLLIESGFPLHSKKIHLPDGRMVPACMLDLTAGDTHASSSIGQPVVESNATESLGSVYRTLMAQAGEVARKQAELDARLDVTLSKMAPAEGRKQATNQGALEAELDTQLMRLKERLGFIDEIEARVHNAHSTASDIERKLAEQMKALADREALVQAVTAEVENIRQISSRSKADLQFVAEHRDDVSDLRAKVEDLLGRVGDTDGKIAMIESRRKTVEEVQARANTITNMLGDINVNLEMLSEQRAVIDHVGEKVARLDFTVQEAQNTLRALKREREVAERIEQGIKALRTHSGANKLS
jgi:archaellum component FlaC